LADEGFAIQFSPHVPNILACGLNNGNLLLFQPNENLNGF